MLRKGKLKAGIRTGSEIVKLALFLFSCLLWLVIGVVFFLIGASFNLKAVAFNEGFMPVLYVEGAELSGDLHKFYYSDDDIRVPGLVDRYRAGNVMFSLGDVLIFSGLLISIISCFRITIHLFVKRKLLKRFTL